MAGCGGGGAGGGAPKSAFWGAAEEAWTIGDGTYVGGGSRDAPVLSTGCGEYWGAGWPVCPEEEICRRAKNSSSNSSTPMGGGVLMDDE